ncbi:MAG: hypothetical protein IPI96_15185 [Saprospiraceae bacterium]|nr:hypothetical protein [Saprospiraceae bacterium]
MRVNGYSYLNLIITENGVKGTNSSYNQANVYSGGSYGVMGGFELLPNPVPAAKMTYNHVARAILGGWAGIPGDFPQDIPSGSSYIKAYNYIVPPNFNISQLKLIGIILNPNGEVLNVNESSIDEAIKSGLFTSTGDVKSSHENISIEPNPANDFAILKMRLLENSDIKVELIELSGNLISKEFFQIKLVILNIL